MTSRVLSPSLVEWEGKAHVPWITSEDYFPQPHADVVDLSNLQRQMIHFTPDVGKPKVESAREKMEAMNPDVTVRTYQEWISAANIAQIIADYDFVIDGTDNFAAKFLINGACVMAGKPYSHGGILQFVGQTMTIRPGGIPLLPLHLSGPAP